MRGFEGDHWGHVSRWLIGPGLERRLAGAAARRSASRQVRHRRRSYSGIRAGCGVTCECGHDITEHRGGPHRGACVAPCLCEFCPEGTVNECWCAGFKPNNG